MYGKEIIFSSGMQLLKVYLYSDRWSYNPAHADSTYRIKEILWFITHMGHMNLGKKCSKDLGEELEEQEGH